MLRRRHNPKFSYIDFVAKREALGDAVRAWRASESRQSASAVRDALRECASTLEMLKWSTPFYAEILGKSLAAHIGEKSDGRMTALAVFVYGAQESGLERLKSWVLSTVGYLCEVYNSRSVGVVLCEFVKDVLRSSGLDVAVNDAAWVTPRTALPELSRIMDMTESDEMEIADLDDMRREFIYSSAGVAGCLYELFTTTGTAEPNIEPFRHKSPFSRSGVLVKKWGAVAAGVLFYCEEDRTVLLGYRSESVQEGFRWGVPGGAVKGEFLGSEGLMDLDEGEEVDVEGDWVWEGAIREVEEECGRLPPNFDARNVVDADDYKQGAFVYRTFIYRISLADKRAWGITANWEHMKFKWWSIDDVPRNTIANLADVVRALAEDEAGARGNPPKRGRRQRRPGRRRRRPSRMQISLDRDRIRNYEFDAQEGMMSSGLDRYRFWADGVFVPMWSFAVIDVLHFFSETLHFIRGTGELRKGQETQTISADSIRTKLVDYKQAPRSTARVADIVSGAQSAPRALVFSWPYTYLCERGWAESERPVEHNPRGIYGYNFAILFSAASATVVKTSAHDFQEITTLDQLEEVIPCRVEGGGRRSAARVYFGLSKDRSAPLFVTDEMPDTDMLPCEVLREVCDFLLSGDYNPEENINETPTAWGRVDEEYDEAMYEDWVTNYTER